MSKTRIPIVMSAVAMLLAACATPTPPAPPPTSAPAPTAAAPAAPAPTKAPEVAKAPEIKADKTKPLGSADNPLIMALAPSATSQELLTTGEAIAKELSGYTGYTIKTTVPTAYSALIEAMGSGNAQIGWLPPLPYLIAKQKGYAEPAFATLRIDAATKQANDRYGVQFLANKDSNFKSYFDEAKQAVLTKDAKEALSQFADKTPCFSDPLSTSGNVIPSGMLAQFGIKVKPYVNATNHPTVARTLYTKGQCDFGATYIDVRDKDSGDKKLVEDLPDIKDKVVVIWRTDNFIPNDNVSYAKEVPADMRAKLDDAFGKLVASDTGKAALKRVYAIDGLKKVDDTFYDSLRSVLAASGVDITKLVK